jgi:hypothetical protein
VDLGQKRAFLLRAERRSRSERITTRTLYAPDFFETAGVTYGDGVRGPSRGEAHTGADLEDSTLEEAIRTELLGLEGLAQKPREDTELLRAQSAGRVDIETILRIDGINAWRYVGLSRRQERSPLGGG